MNLFVALALIKLFLRYWWDAVVFLLRFYV